jgi:hypothetical protein
MRVPHRSAAPVEPPSTTTRKPRVNRPMTAMPYHPLDGNPGEISVASVGVGAKCKLYIVVIEQRLERHTCQLFSAVMGARNMRASAAVPSLA